MSARDIIEALTRGTHLVLPVFLATVFVALPAAAQSPLLLSEAIARAKARNPDALSAAAAEREAADHVTQVRGGYFPRVDVTESWQRGNHPVFVFSSLLAQRQFTAADFALDAINHPDATDNFRTAFFVEQPLFDRTTSANVGPRRSRRSPPPSAHGRRVACRWPPCPARGGACPLLHGESPQACRTGTHQSADGSRGMMRC